MKKLLAIILAALMMLTLVACAETNANENNGNDTEANEEANATLNDIVFADVAKAIMTKYAEYIDLPTQYDAFMAEADDEMKAMYPTYDVFLFGDAETETYGQMMLSEVEVNAEWMSGLTAAPTGYAEAYTFAPGMMGQAFVGYMFRLEEGTDVEAFKKSLTDNCDMRWNICTAANTVVCENIGNYVYFSMLVIDNGDGMGGFTQAQADSFYSVFEKALKG